MSHHFEEFIKSGVYLRAWSPKTVRTYQQGLNAFQMALGEGRNSGLPDATGPTGNLTKAHLDTFVIWMRQKGLSAGGCNMYIRTVNSYLSWLHEEGHISQKLRIKLLPNPNKPLSTFSDTDVRLILSFKPKGPYQLRTWTLIICLLDTGIRIDEALGLERSKVNLDTLQITVLGKGNKERIVPISLEFRKHLFRFMQKSEGQYVFGARTGLRLQYRNSYRDIKNLCKRIGFEGEHVHPHSCRHYFAVSYIRNGGDIYRLSRILGHTSISTTQLYLRSMGVEHLLEGHSQFSPLARLA
jgi:site-specific recombinase XerD